MLQSQLFTTYFHYTKCTHFWFFGRKCKKKGSILTEKKYIYTLLYMVHDIFILTYKFNNKIIIFQSLKLHKAPLMRTWQHVIKAKASPSTYCHCQHLLQLRLGKYLIGCLHLTSWYFKEPIHLIQELTICATIVFLRSITALAWSDIG